METLNIQCIEHQQVLITITLTDSDGAPVDLTQYAVYAASVGAVDPYCRRAARLEWATGINNECSAFIITAPGHDIARAPWKYQICIKNRQLGLEWAVVTGRVELTPRACGTDGISPASYSVACEATPSGLVNVTLDATVGSISTTLEQVKASAAAAAAAAQNAHADAEDSEAAATRASQAALAAAADARVASEKATAAEAAATAAPEACAPYVQQVQQAAAAALDASRAATTAATEAQASADAAAPAQGYATRAEEAKTAAVQAAETATTAATTATQQADAATAQAESARLAATTATTASDNAQAAATRAEGAATRAEAAAPAATRAEAARDAAEAAAATATTAAADLPQLTQRAEDAATASEAAQTAAETAQSTAETAAATATTQADAASASATQADTDARACAIYDQRVAANAAAAADSATAAATSEINAAASASAAATAAERTIFEQAATIYAATKNMDDGVVYSYNLGKDVYKYAVAKNSTAVINRFYKADTVILHGSGYGAVIQSNTCKLLFSDDATSVGGYSWGALTGDRCYIHLPNVVDVSVLCNRWTSYITFSEATKFEKTEIAFEFMSHISGDSKNIQWAAGTTFSSLITATNMFYASAGIKSLPDDFTFEKVQDARRMLESSGIEKLPQSMNLGSLLRGDTMLKDAKKVEIEDIVRVCNTINNLQALPEPKTGSLGLPSVCKHNGENVTSKDYLNINYPDFLTTLAAKGWTVTFG